MEPTQPLPAQPERAVDTSGVEVPTPADPAPAPAPSAQPPAQPASVAPVNLPAPAVSAPAAPMVAPTPVVAEDVDVIEKEWVDAASEVVKSGADDPHKEEEGFEDLQVSYLKKRYNKDIKKPSE